MDYTATRDGLVLRQLTKYGSSMTVERKIGASVDAASGEHTPGTTANTVTKGLLKDYKKSELDGDLIRAGDMKALVAATAFARAKIQPAPGDVLIQGGVRWRVMNVKAIQPGGVPVAYWLQVRK